METSIQSLYIRQIRLQYRQRLIPPIKNTKTQLHTRNHSIDTDPKEALQITPMSTRLELQPSELTPASSQSQLSFWPDRSAVLKNEAAKNALLLERLNCMLKGDIQKMSLIDIETMKKCVDNLDIYFCMDPHKQSLLAAIRENIGLLQGNA